MDIKDLLVASETSKHSSPSRIETKLSATKSMDARDTHYSGANAILVQSSFPGYSPHYRTLDPLAPSSMCTTEAQPHPGESLSRKNQAKWSLDDDKLLVELCNNDMRWEDIAKRFRGRSAISCRMRYQKHLEHPEWNEDMTAQLAALYERFKPEMWHHIAQEMHLPWRAAEDKHWELRKMTRPPYSKNANKDGGAIASSQPQ